MRATTYIDMFAAQRDERAAARCRAFTYNEKEHMTNTRATGSLVMHVQLRSTVLSHARKKCIPNESVKNAGSDDSKPPFMMFKKRLVVLYGGGAVNAPHR